MAQVQQSGKATRVTASGVTVLSSGPTTVLGIWVAAVLTGQIVQVWAGNTTATTVIGTCTLVPNTFYPFPFDLPTGLTYAVTNEDIDLTIYWQPTGG